jgi:hypothetical protein
LKANKVILFVFSVLFVFWYHSPKYLDTPRIKVLVFQFDCKCVFVECDKDTLLLGITKCILCRMC